MPDRYVEQFLTARDRHIQVDPPSQTKPFTAEEAYEIQDRLRQALVARGETVIGWKAGLTDRASQAAFHSAEPLCAFLLGNGVFTSGAEVPVSRFAHLVVEAEVAFVMGDDLAGPGVTPPRALLAAEGALPALELVDFRFRGKPTGTDIIAEGVYANAIVLGAPLTSVTNLDLALEGMVYEHNGAVAATNTAAEVMGNPANALAWIANHLGRRGLSLRAGDIVMSGSVSLLLHGKAGDSVRAAFTRLGSVAAHFA